MSFLIKSKKDKNECCSVNIDELILKEEGNTKVDEPYSVESSEPNNLIIKILGSGCKNCITLQENVILTLRNLNLNAHVNKVTDIAEITSYGVMSTPALVINEKVVSYGKVLKPNDIAKILEKEIN